LCEPVQYIFAPCLIRIETGLKKILEKEKAEYDEKNEELDQDNHPETPANGHASESVVIKPEDPYEEFSWHRTGYFVEKV
jgi:hypothetical protein